MSNTNYAIAAGGYTGQPPFTASSTEIVLARDWENIYLRDFAMLAMIREGKKNWNKPGLRKGNMLLLPVLAAAASTLPGGVTMAGEFTPITPYRTNGLTQAQYNIAQYRHAFYLTANEKQLINNARGNYLQGKVDQLMADFTSDIADDLLSANADADNAALGVQWAIATGNLVGNIDQSSVANWRGNVTTSAGPLDLDMIDLHIGAVNNKRGNIDLMLFSYDSSNDLFSKFRAQISPAARLVNADFKAKYGFTNIEYMGATCVQEGRLTAGVIVGFDTSSWYYSGDLRPNKQDVIRIPGTGVEEHYYDMFLGVGTNNPGKNFRITGVS